MAYRYDVIVYGTVCLDAIWRVRELPPPGGYVPILEERKMVGGEAANTAIALARWGVRVALVGNGLGEDDDGCLLRQLFAEQAPEIDTRFLATSSAWRTPYCLCIATPDGHRTMFGRGFSEMQCPPLDPELARSARFFTMEPNAWEAGLRACMVAAEAGTSIVAMDYTREPAVNRVAAISVTSTDHIGPDKTPEEQCAYAARLRDEYGTTAIVTNGERGCFVAAKDGARGEGIHVPAYVAPELLDTTGAGDIFRAGLLYGQLQNWEILRTVRFASAAAALNCGALGGWGGVRSVSEILAFQKTV
ncbi:MAG TPA: PfkB family carbohydrate kinase [Chthonomonadaceae bacterium]|nr:PfkB family carbohydrate kinase [Chthonomonadaceae bacterium]